MLYCCLEKDVEVWHVAETCRCFGCWYFIMELFAQWLMTAARRNGYGHCTAQVVFAGRCENAVMCVPNRTTWKTISVLTKKWLQKKSYLDWIFRIHEQNLMFGTSLTNAQSDLSNEKPLFVKQENKRHWWKGSFIYSFMERTCFAQVQNWLCSYWWVFLRVKWLMKTLTLSPCLSFEALKCNFTAQL